MERTFLIKKIVTGGQTGTDRAALDFALAAGIPCSGWCPRGRLAEDGTIADRYPLQETPSDDVSERTAWNVRDSDGTLILMHGDPVGGTLLTIQCAQKYSRPVFQTEMLGTPNVEEFEKWLCDHKIAVLNIAGPRESLQPGIIYSRSLVCLRTLLQAR